ncbi:MAG: hypothetical protein JJU29_04130 [Verrucomicrobia bacterium]|nr:hypothetical protein [Verrucomicrobiota bacterium]MCH8511747.1 hypothetical protein [Kiritimatiellia bacterium]
MSPLPTWLPTALALADFTDLNALEAAAYAHFRSAWASHPNFRGDEVRVHRHPHLANSNRWNTYWHCVTEGHPESTRTNPIPDRLERIPWARPIIENETEAHSGIKVWANIRGRDRHVCIWFEPENYLIVLKVAKDHFVLKTTYRPESRRRSQLHRDYANWKKTGRDI